MLRQVSLDPIFSAQASHLVAFSRKRVSWIDVFSCVYCNFPPKIELSLEPRAFLTVRFLGPQSAAQASNLRVFWSSWGVSLEGLGVPLDLLGDPWGSFAISLGRLGNSWPPLGRPLAPLRAHFADPCPLFGHYLGALGHRF